MSNSICLDPQPTTVTVVQGDDITINAKIVDSKTGDPLDFSDSSEIVAVLPSTNVNGYIEKKQSLGQVTKISDPGGRIGIIIPRVDSLTLTPGPSVGFEVRVTINGLTTTVQFLNALNIIPSLFPTAP